MHHGTHHVASRVRSGVSTAFDRLMLLVGTAAAFMTLPQIVSVWQHGPEGVSLASWLAYTVHSCFWVTYGLVHRESIIVWTNAIWVVMNGLVIAGVLFSR